MFSSATFSRSNRRHFGPWPALAGAALVTVILAGGFLRAAETLVLYSDTHTRQLPVTRVEGQRYIPLMDLLSVLGNVSTLQKSSALLQLKVEKHTLFVRPNSTLAVVDGALSSLDDPILVLSSEWMVPVQFINKIFPRLTERKVIYRSGSLRAFVTLQLPARVYIEAAKGIVSSRIAVEVSQAVPFEMKRDGSQITLTLGTRPLDSEIEKLNYADDQIKSILFEESDGKPKVRVTLASADAEVKTSTAQDGRVFVIVISRVQPLPPLPKSAPSQLTSTPPTAAGPTSLTSPLPQRMALRTITLDVGHGGLDSGARSAGEAVVEKTLVLQIAQRFRFALQRRLGIQVFLTREGDSDLSLDQRAIIANTNHSDLFISLHAGFSLVRNWTGARVYIDAPVKKPAPPPSATSAPASTRNDNETTASRAELPHIYFRDWNQANAPNFQLNEALAEVVLAELSGVWTHELGAPRVAPLKPLANVVMPSILVELGNLNSDSDVKQLLNPQFQNSVAGAIANAVERFKPIYEAQETNAPTH